MQLEIVDTVYIVAYLRRSDPLHGEAVSIVERLGPHRKVSQASLIELDLLMKSRGFTFKERLKSWTLLGKIIPEEAIEPLNPHDFAIATVLVEEHGLDYFDALIAAQCIARNAKPLTTDRDIVEIVSKTSMRELLDKYRANTT